MFNKRASFSFPNPQTSTSKPPPLLMWISHSEIAFLISITFHASLKIYFHIMLIFYKRIHWVLALTSCLYLFLYISCPYLTSVLWRQEQWAHKCSIHSVKWKSPLTKQRVVHHHRAHAHRSLIINWESAEGAVWLLWGEMERR